MVLEECDDLCPVETHDHQPVEHIHRLLIYGFLRRETGFEELVDASERLRLSDETEGTLVDVDGALDEELSTRQMLIIGRCAGCFSPLLQVQTARGAIVL